MLILRRKSGESIVVGNTITLTVLDINEGSVRLAIDAPKAIPILRSELLQAADANRDSAAAQQSASHGLLRLLENAERSRRPHPVRPGAGHASKAPHAEPPAPLSGGAVNPSAPSDAPTPSPSGESSDASAPSDTYSMTMKSREKPAYRCYVGMRVFEISSRHREASSGNYLP